MCFVPLPVRFVSAVSMLTLYVSLERTCLLYDAHLYGYGGRALVIHISRAFQAPSFDILTFAESLLFCIM